MDGIRRHDRVLVACSGGADSTALALLVCESEERAGDEAPAVILGHVHHGIRGADADADAEFVEELGRSLGKRVVVERLTLARASETEARERRLEVFRQWAREHELDAILLAHHRDDQRETILLRICRGTGFDGLAGISGSRPLYGAGRSTLLCRPLLDLTRAQIRAFLDARGQTHRHDTMNDDLAVPRNRIRHEVLPLLEDHVHPGIRASLDRLGEHASGVASGYAWVGALLYERFLIAEGDREVVLNRAVLISAPDAVRRSVLRHVEQRLEPDSHTRLNDAKTSLINQLLDDWHELPGRLDLGGGLVFELTAEHVSLRRETTSESEITPTRPEALELSIDGDELDWQGWRIRASSGDDWSPSEDPLEEWIDEQALSGALHVRSRQDGDRFWPLGSSGHKKLKEFLRERGVERGERDQLPIVTSGDEIVWVVGERIAHSVRLREDTVRAIRLSARPPQG
jgi:tRNA(Ile)-lysidine synthase